ncbi:aminodeoxychorismate synthase component I [Haloimpatiens sp. FM7330]|uniref:aminodeoxychorismate synthase component I n=1 Tax=Haloimpatiens sp. FM7330 TaxID=3298610 RepID=UPI003644324A
MNLSIKEINTHLNAFEVYSIFKNEKDTILLDSSNDDEKLSRYSFVGINPFLKFKAVGNEINIGNMKIQGDPFIELDKLIKKYSISYESDIPFLCGCIGYFSYDIGKVIEKIPDTSKEDFKIPDAYFIFYDNLIVFDLINNKTYITSLGILEEGEKSINFIEEKIEKGSKIEEKMFESENTKFYSNFDEEQYIKTVAKVREYIRNGDIYITNLTQRLWCYNEKNSFDIYKKLRTINKAPFSAFLNLDDFSIMSSSPERFMSIRNGKVQTRPIKGTRPRGNTKEEDEKYKKELMNSEKDKAELLMIVDLERNDLSKVCKKHSVKVSELFKLEKYATVFHLVSTVEGELREDVSPVQCIRECFPGGSITGAPKIRSMEIIEELEGLKRNLYTGSIGYFDLRGNADFNIVIRTIVKKNDKCYLGVGGGITYDSIEKMEYDETIDKAKALMRVL